MWVPESPPTESSKKWPSQSIAPAFQWCLAACHRPAILPPRQCLAAARGRSNWCWSLEASPRLLLSDLSIHNRRMGILMPITWPDKTYIQRFTDDYNWHLIWYRLQTCSSLQPQLTPEALSPPWPPIAALPQTRLFHHSRFLSNLCPLSLAGLAVAPPTPGLGVLPVAREPWQGVRNARQNASRRTRFHIEWPTASHSAPARCAKIGIGLLWAVQIRTGKLWLCLTWCLQLSNALCSWCEYLGRIPARGLRALRC